jgi:hypothetical protein
MLMFRAVVTGSLALLLPAVLLHRTALPAFHFWEIQEIFTNHDGTVQFIELFTTAPSEVLVDDHQITANSDGVIRTFTFDHDLVGSTASKHLLIATSGFGALTTPNAVNPDFEFAVPTLYPRFFEPNATSIAINFIGADSVTFAGSLLPKDGVNSLHFTVAGAPSTGTNSPRNFAGAMGAVNLPPPPPPNNGDYNGDLVVNAADYTVWRNSFGQNVTQSSGADGNNNSVIDRGDYTFWKQQYGTIIGSGAGQTASPVPEPSTLVIAVTIFGLLTRRPIRRFAGRVSQNDRAGF